MKYNQYKKLAGALCLTVGITGSAIPYNVFRTPVQVMAAVEADIADAETIDISKVETIDGIRQVEIEKSGKYILTGSNYVERDEEKGTGGVYEDVNITVKEGVTADLYLNDLKITNDDGYINIYGSGDRISGDISPLVIDGTANIYICDDSTLEALQKIVTVNGTMNIFDWKKSETKDSPKLNLKLAEKDTYISDIPIMNGTGQVNLEDGTVTVDTLPKNYCDKFTINPKVIVSGGNFIWTEAFTDKKFPNSLIVDGGYVGINGIVSTVKNSQDETLQSKTFNNLPVGEDVLQINCKSQKGVKVDQDGVLKTYIPYDTSEAVIYIGDTAYTYDQYGDTYIDSGAYCKATFVDKDTNEIITEYFLRVGKAFELPRRVGYQYTFSCNGDEITKDTIVTEDQEIKVTKMTNQYIVSIDGNTVPIAYEDPLPGENACYLIKDGKYVMYYPGDPITEDLTLTSIPLKTEGRYVLIDTENDLAEFSKFVNAGCTTINGKLTHDLVTDESYVPIGKYVSDNECTAYQGIFDGQGHSVDLKINCEDQNYVGFFSVIGNGAVIKNLTTTGTVHGNYAVGGLVGGSFGVGAVTIENCTNYAEVVGANTDVAGIIGTNQASLATFNISNCANHGSITGKKYATAISGWGGKKAVINNCYNDGQITNTNNLDIYDIYRFIRGDNLTLKNCYDQRASYNQIISGLSIVSSEQIASGEIAWKLNGSDNDKAPVWFQTCDDKGKPILNGDPNTQTVYYGYKTCDSTEKEYSNEKHLQQGHQYMYSMAEDNGNRVIAYSCEFCEETKATAILTVQDYTVGDAVFKAAIQYSTEWTTMNQPALTLKYADSIDGEYKTDVPTEIGTWYVKVYVEGQEEPIGDAISFKINPNPTNNSTNNSTNNPTNNPTPVPTEVPTPELEKEKEELEVKDGTLVSCDIAKDGNVTIPDSIAKTITEISADTFRNNDLITSVDLSNTNIKTISRLAFDNCENLKEITLPPTVEKIDASAFRNCSSLEKIVLPASLKTISVYAFANCSNLTSITLERGFNGAINATAFSKTDITIYGYGRTKEQIKAGVKEAKSFANKLGVPFVYIKSSAVTKPTVTLEGGIIRAKSQDPTVSYYQLWKWDENLNRFKYVTSKKNGKFNVNTAGSYRIVAVRKYGNGMSFRSKSSNSVIVK